MGRLLFSFQVGILLLALSAFPGTFAIRIRAHRRHSRSGATHVKQSPASSTYVATGTPTYSVKSALLQTSNNIDVTSPNLQLNNLILFSKRLVEVNASDNEPAPCVVFFPGDVSDLVQNLAAQEPEFQRREWTLEGIHTTIARRYPAYDVITVRGELDGTQRSFSNLVGDPMKAIRHVEGLLSSVQSGSKLVLVGFSRGGLGLSTLINGAEAKPAFWTRVESIHYVDVGGDGWVGDPRGLSVLAQSNGKIWLNFQLTPWCERYADGRNLMITLARSVGLFVQVESAPLTNSFAAHMRILSDFNIVRHSGISQPALAKFGGMPQPVHGNIFGMPQHAHGHVGDPRQFVPSNAPISLPQGPHGQVADSRHFVPSNVQISEPQRPRGHVVDHRQYVPGNVPISVPQRPQIRVA